jgi:hypothetical protein
MNGHNRRPRQKLGGERLRGVLKGGTRHEATHLYSQLTALQPRSPRSDPRCSTAAPRASLKRMSRLSEAANSLRRVETPCVSQTWVAPESVRVKLRTSFDAVPHRIHHFRPEGVCQPVISGIVFSTPTASVLAAFNTRWWGNICLRKGSDGTPLARFSPRSSRRPSTSSPHAHNCDRH